MPWTSEADLEVYFIEELRKLGFALQHGSEISPETRNPMRANFRETILAPVFFDTLPCLNPNCRRVR